MAYVSVSQQVRCGAPQGINRVSMCTCHILIITETLMSSVPDRRGNRPVTLSRALDEVCAHPVITGVAVVGVAVTLAALLHYGPSVRTHRGPSLFERIADSLRSLFD